MAADCAAWLNLAAALRFTDDGSLVKPCLLLPPAAATGALLLPSSYQRIYPPVIVAAP